MRRILGLSVAAGVSAALVVPGSACRNPAAPSDTAGFFGSVEALGSTNVAAVSHPGTPPAAGSGPAVSATSEADAIKGGTNVITLQSALPFKTVYVTASGGSQASVMIAGFGAAPAEATAPAAEGFMQISLPSPVTTASIGLTYSDALPSSGVTLGFQVAGDDGSTGPVATITKRIADRTVYKSGQVWSYLGLNMSGGPGIYTDPIAGATVSTSLDSRTATTDANGAFYLQTATAPGGQCYTITITRGGAVVYSQRGRWGDAGGFTKYLLTPPAPDCSIPGATCGC
jgi:hypothetical protein